MIRRGAAATAGDVNQATFGKFTNKRRGLCRCFVVFTKGIRQTGVGVRRHKHIGFIANGFDVRAHGVCTKRTVKANRQQVAVTNRVPKGFGSLTRQRTARGIGDRTGNHDRQFAAQGFKHALYGKNRGFTVQRIEHGFDQNNIRATVD